MGKGPVTGGDMRSAVHDYEWSDLGAERGGPLKGLREKLLSHDPETGAYTRLIIFEPGFRFEKVRTHDFWEEVYVLEGHMMDYATNTLYTKGSYALRQPGVLHGPFGSGLGCTLIETVWYDRDWYRRNP
ncbi:MAG TPA: cupin domain-containing protein [Feifaniaceae bacterium]|nr:cupin domain-containing protein [Feifaniaceae bacterium]